MQLCVCRRVILSFLFLRKVSFVVAGYNGIERTWNNKGVFRFYEDMNKVRIIAVVSLM